jgi:hypothetical protein
MFFRNVSRLSRDYRALYSRRQILRNKIVWFPWKLNELYLNSLVKFHCSVWLTSCSWALPQKPPIMQLLKNFPAFHWTRRFVTVFTKVLHWSLSWARSIQFIPPHPFSLNSILILSTHLRLGPPSGLFPYDLPTNILYTFLFSPFVLHVLPIPFTYTWSF